MNGPRRCFVTAIACCLIASAALAETWTDASGTYSIEAEFVKLDPGQSVTLKKPDGTVISVPLSKLSVASRNLAEQLHAAKSQSAAFDAKAEYEQITSLSKKFLQLWQKKDLVGAMRLVPDIPPEVLDQAKPGGEIYQQMLGDTSPLWHAVRDWNGDVEVRLRRSQALILPKPKALSAQLAQGRIVVAEMRWEGGEWKYAGIFVNEEARKQDNVYERAEASKAESYSALQALAKACRANDVERTTALCTTGLLEFSQELAARAERGRGSLTDSDRIRILVSAVPASIAYDALVDWDGRVLEKSKIQQTALVKFGEFGDDKSWVVELDHDGRGWKVGEPREITKQNWSYGSALEP